jgi:hypothetical protein
VSLCPALGAHLGAPTVETSIQRRPHLGEVMRAWAFADALKLIIAARQLKPRAQSDDLRA